MRKLIIPLMMLITLTISAQDKRFTTGIYLEHQHYSQGLWDKADGFNIGAFIEYQMTTIYLKVQTYWFPDLNDLPYWDFSGVVGLNHHALEDKIRVFAGFKMGLITRNYDGIHPMLGLESGIEWYFSEKLLLGLVYSFEHKTDDKYWSPKSTGHNVSSFGIKIGVVL